MTETASVVAALVMVGVVGAVPLAAVAGGTAGAPGDEQVAPNGTVEPAPGERLSGVVGAERASVEAEIASRTFGQRMATASSNDSRAAVVGDEVEALQARLDELREERAELEAARENGTVSQSEYRARAVRLHAEGRALRRRANDTERVAGAMPAEHLRANGVNVTALRTVRSETRTLTGPKMAAVARNVSGPNPGGRFGPGDAGPPGVDRNWTGGGPGGDRGPSDDTRGGGPSDDTRGGGPSDDTRGGGPSDDTRGGGPSDTETDRAGDAGNRTASPDDGGGRP